MKQSRTCCFLGHRRITENEKLIEVLYAVIETMIRTDEVDTFLFGSKSRFNDLCLELVTDLKEKYPHIKRIYVRAEYPHISDEYEEYLLQIYDETYYPETIQRSGSAVYVERNCEMIDRSRYCIIYYDQQNMPVNRKSGTEIAFHYATKKGKRIVKLPLQKEN